jgi:DNA-binding SARP family transcriptional activator
MSPSSSGSRGPHDQLARPALVERVAAHRVTLVEAGAGAGKSTLLAELADTAHHHVVTLQCLPSDADASVFAGHVLGAISRSGLPVAGADAPASVARAIGAAFTASSAPVLLAVDDAQHLEGEGSDLLAALVDAVGGSGAVVVLARRLNDEAVSLRRIADLRLDDADLAFDAADIGLLCDQVDVVLGSDAVEQLATATKGWAAAVSLAVARLSRSSEPERELERILRHPAVFEPLVDELLADLPPESRSGVAQLAHLPFASPDLAAAVGRPSLLDELEAAGLALSPVPGGWVALPGPVAQVLAAREQPEVGAVRASASAFAALGEPLVGAGVLVSAGLVDDAAELLAGLPSVAFGPVDHAALDAIVAELPRRSVDAHPAILLHLARTALIAGRLHRRTAVLEWARDVLADGRDPATARAVEAELVRDRVRNGDDEGGHAEALALLAACEPLEHATRAALLHAVGSSAVRLGRTREAERAFEESIELYRRIGDGAGLADALIGLGYTVHCYAGEHDLGIARLQEVLALEDLSADLRAATSSLLAETLETAGRLDEADRTAAAGVALAERLGNRRLAAYGEWERARIAAARGDAAGVERGLRGADANRGDWIDELVGAQFLADAAELCVRVGDDLRAASYLERARAHPRAIEPLCALAEAAVEARRGDALEALRLLEEADVDESPNSRLALMVAVLRAHAAARAGLDDAGQRAVAVVDRAGKLGDPGLLFGIDADLASGVVERAAAEGSPAAQAAAAAGRAVSVAVLGRCEVFAGARQVPLPPGLAPRLIGLLAVNDGHLHVEALLDALWADEPVERSRTLLRKLLSRLRTATGLELVERDGDVLRLPPGTATDLEQFEVLSRTALDARTDDHIDALAPARAALAAYRGDLLPDEPYEEWTVVPRERLRRRRIALLELLAADAAGRTDLGAGLDLIEDLIEAEPDEESHYLMGVRLLMAAGQIGRARAYLARADAAIDRLGLPRTDEHEALRRRLGIP